jgi:hypothetical protein
MVETVPREVAVDKVEAVDLRKVEVVDPRKVEVARKVVEKITHSPEEVARRVVADSAAGLPTVPGPDVHFADFFPVLVRAFENTRTRFSSNTPRLPGIVFGLSCPHSFPVPRTTG